MTTLRRLYDRLTPDERLCAFVEALARRDYPELDRLNETCPPKTYVSDDWAYRGRLLDLRFLALNHALDIQWLGQGALVTLALCLIADTKGDEAAHEDLSEDVERIGGHLLAHLEAWRRFCADLGIDGDRVCAAFQLDPLGPLAVLLGDEGRAIFRLEPDADEVKKQLERLRSVWLDAVRRADGANRRAT